MRLRVEEQRLLPGCSAGLGQATAVVTVDLEGGLDTGAFARVHAGAAGLIPEQPLFGVTESDWPAVFLLDPADGGASPESRLGQWIVALTVALQRWARDAVWRGRVLGVAGGRLMLAIPWQREGVLSDTLRLALRLIELWAAPPAGRLTDVNAAIRQGMAAAQDKGLLPSDVRFALAALERGIPVTVRPNHIQYGWGVNSERMRSTFTGNTSHIGGLIAQNKILAAQFMREADIPVPRGELVSDFDRAVEMATGLGWPVVVKPLNQEQGRGVTTGVGDEVSLRQAFTAAEALSPGQIIVEEHVAGDDHRLLVVGGRLLAAARRIPGGVVGDGVRTVEQLIARINADPRRGDDQRSLLKRLTLDAEALELLADQGVPIASVPAAGTFVALRRTANISTGGTAEDVTAGVHPDNRMLVERAARVVGLDVVGVDFLTTDVGRSWREIGGAICEVNAQPGLRPHWLADPQRDVNGEILDRLFAGRPTRIPTVAITGTNGKSTTSLMLQHIWQTAGLRAGVCTTHCLRIGEETVSTRNLSGFPGARMLLNDPAVEVAIIEMPRKGLIIFGHPCDRYDVAALLDIQDDHLGSLGIDTLDQMAELKSEVLQRARQAVVVNGDDPRCVAMLARAGTDRHILVSTRPDTVASHRRRGGAAVVLAKRDGEPWLILCDGDSEAPLMAAADIPATMGGLLRFNQTNAMFAAALAWAQGLEPGVIRTALASFQNSVEHNPGRYNFIDGLPFEVLLDYAHNVDGVREVCEVVDRIQVTGRKLLCSLMIGNPGPGQYVELAPRLARTFDSFVVGCNPPSVFRNEGYPGADPVGAMLAHGHRILADNDVPAERIWTEGDPPAAVRLAMDVARPGDLVVLLGAPSQALPVIDEFMTGRGSSPAVPQETP